jgi:hypothetical protein
MENMPDQSAFGCKPRNKCGRMEDFWALQKGTGKCSIPTPSAACSGRMLLRMRQRFGIVVPLKKFIKIMERCL